MTNAEWMIKHGYNFINLRAFDADNANRAYKIGLCMEGYTWEWVGEVTKVYHDKSTAVLAWLDMKHKESILDDAEKAYLSAVIKPFRDRVKSICKVNYLGVSSSGYQYIFITLSDGSYNIDLPIFKRDSMYKGMTGGRDYTVEELGL